LITLLLCYDNALRQPLLYLSLYFKTHRQRYYELLQRIRMEGDWEEWLVFFLEGVRETSDQAANTAHEILALFDDDNRRIVAELKSSGSAMRLHALLQKRPLLHAKTITRELGMTLPTANAALENLRRLGIVTERTGRRRNRLYAYDRYLAILSEGTEPLR
jgi:Fic family protein